jgi:hypothetical protein
MHYDYIEKSALASVPAATLSADEHALLHARR